MWRTTSIIKAPFIYEAVRLIPVATATLFSLKVLRTCHSMFLPSSTTTTKTTSHSLFLLCLLN